MDLEKNWLDDLQLLSIDFERHLVLEGAHADTPSLSVMANQRAFNNLADLKDIVHAFRLFLDLPIINVLLALVIPNGKVGQHFVISHLLNGVVNGVARGFQEIGTAMLTVY